MNKKDILVVALWAFGTYGLCRIALDIEAVTFKHYLAKRNGRTLKELDRIMDLKSINQLLLEYNESHK